MQKRTHKTKILRIIARLNVGGPAINAVLLTEGLNGKFESVLAAGPVGKDEGDMSYLAHEKGIMPVNIREMGRDIKWSSDIKALWRLFWLIKKERPSIVHTHTAKAGTLGRIASVLADVPVRVHTFHGHVFNDYFHPVKAKCFILIEKFLSLFTDRIIAVGDTVREELCSRYRIAPRRKVNVIRLGFELERFLNCDTKKEILKSELKIEDDCHLVGIIGRLVPIKNHKMFLDAAKRLRIAYSALRIKFIVAGDGELRKGLEEYAGKLGIAEDVIFLGWRKDLDAVYAGLDVVCLTSLNEGTPVSLIEAQAAARPVVAADVGGVRDVVTDGKTGILVKPQDADGMAKGIKGLLEDSQRRASFGLGAREAVRDKFCKARLIKETTSLYTELLRKKGVS